MTIQFTIFGEIKGGKNNYIVLRNGRHIPKKDWADWRDRVVADLKDVLKPTRDTMIVVPCRMRVAYTPKNLRRRDITAVLDSIFHCMERSGLISDDFLVKDLKFVTFPPDKKNPSCQVIIETKNA